ncbi:MAG: hypothetical protein KA748_10345 [Halomonas sp.]|nr:hypothetical protein [Halomonas sp.]MBP5980595.1 hypothetical protein [Halomonas sp.]
MHTNLLYIGPLRPETLALLEALPPAEHALFVIPTPNAPLWEEVLGLFPQAKQQITKVAETSGELPYYEYNLPEFNASQPASGLYTLYPGLELMESSPQPLVGAEALLSDLPSAPDTLVIEQPELVWPLLQALAALPSYKQLSELCLRVGAVPLYEGTPEADEILIWCQEQGFELQVTNEDDPDLPLLQLARHTFYKRWQEELKRADSLTKKLKVLEKDFQNSNDKNALKLEKEKVSSLDYKVKKLIDKNKSLRSNIELIKKNIEVKEKDLFSYQVDCENKEKYCQSILNEVDKVKKDLNDFKIKVSEYRHSEKQLLEKNKELEDALREAINVKAKISQEIEDNRLRLTKNKEKEKEQQEQLLELSQNHKKVSQENQVLTSRIDSMKKELEKAHVQIRKIKKFVFER